MEPEYKPLIKEQNGLENLLDYYKMAGYDSVQIEMKNGLYLRYVMPSTENDKAGRTATRIVYQDKEFMVFEAIECFSDSLRDDNYMTHGNELYDYAINVHMLTGIQPFHLDMTEIIVG